MPSPSAMRVLDRHVGQEAVDVEPGRHRRGEGGVGRVVDRLDEGDEPVRHVGPALVRLRLERQRHVAPDARPQPGEVVGEGPLVVEERPALLAEPRLEERLAHRLHEGEEPPVLAVHGEPGEGVAGSGDPHRLEDQEGQTLVKEARVLREVVDHEALVAVVLLGGHVLVELDLEARLLLAARALAAGTDAGLQDGDTVHRQVGGVVLVGLEVARAVPARPRGRGRAWPRAGPTG